jgi:tRNA(Ile)-lysidine synthase
MTIGARIDELPQQRLQPAAGRRWQAGLLETDAQGIARARRAELRGTLSFEPAAGAGLDPGRLAPGALDVRTRRGGERLRLGAGRPSRSLKNLFQESAVPPWERAAVPLVYCGGRLACVPGLGVAPEYAAAAGAVGIGLRWTPFRATKPVIK